MNMRRSLLSLAPLAASAGWALATPGYESGNIVLAHYSPDLEGPAILEYTPEGELVRELPVFGPQGEDSWSVRDLVVDPEGRIHLSLSLGRFDGNRTLATARWRPCSEQEPGAIRASRIGPTRE